MDQDKRRRIRKFGELFTPQWVVEMMCDSLEQESGPDTYSPASTFLEPSCGEGVFVLEVLRRKFANCRCRADFSTAVRSVYAFDIQADNVEKTIDAVTGLCRQHFRPTGADLEAIRNHVIQADALKVLRMMRDQNLQTSPGF